MKILGYREQIGLIKGCCNGEQPLHCKKLSSHVAAFDDKIQHLQALRTDIQQLTTRRPVKGRGACNRAGCGPMDAPALSSGAAASGQDSVEDAGSSGQAFGKNGPPMTQRRFG